MASKINDADFDLMFETAGISREKLRSALLEMGPKNLKDKSMRDEWTADNPSKNYCYVVSEFVYWYVAPEGSTPYALTVPTYDTLHRFLKWPNGTIVDLTGDQFDNYYDIIDYTKAKRCGFLQTGCKGPSRRARLLATLMGYKEDAWNSKTGTTRTLPL